MALGLIAAGLAGAGSGLLGLGQAKKMKRQQMRAIEEAFRIAKLRQATTQGDVRQSSIESLNARGLLTGGSGSVPPTAPVPRPVGMISGGTFGKPGANPRTVEANKQAMRAYEIARQSGRGEVGPANTLAGQAQRDLSREFGLENEDLRAQHAAARAGVSAEYSRNALGALGGAISTAFGVKGLVDSFAAPKLPDPPSGLDNPNPLGLPDTIEGAFGIDPVDPLNPRGSVGGFNVTRK